MITAIIVIALMITAVFAVYQITMSADAKMRDTNIKHMQDMLSHPDQWDYFDNMSEEQIELYKSWYGIK